MMRAWLAQAEARLLAAAHPDRARRDAEALLLAALGRNKAWLMAHGDEGLPDEQARRLAQMLERRVAGEPMQYILGEAEFYGLPFRVTPDVLIPRPETEHLVEKVIELAGQFSCPRIADVGTGSGAIAVALAHHLPQAEFTALDLSAAALLVARENARQNEVADRIRILQGDLLAPVAGEQFEIIVSNPPYVPTADRDALSVEVREFEPGLALFAGEDGLAVYRRLIPAACAVLAPGGWLALEIGYGQKAAVGGLLEGSGFEGIAFIPDLQGIARVACGRR